MDVSNRLWERPGTALVGAVVAPPKPIDLGHLGRYTLGDRNLEQEILGLFVAELPKTIAALQDAQSERDWRVAAHTLKGSGRAVGAWRVAKAAQTAESIKSVTDRGARQLVLAHIEDAAREVESYIAGLTATR